MVSVKSTPATNWTQLHNIKEGKQSVNPQEAPTPEEWPKRH